MTTARDHEAYARYVVEVWQDVLRDVARNPFGRRVVPDLPGWECWVKAQLLRFGMRAAAADCVAWKLAPYARWVAAEYAFGRDGAEPCGVDYWRAVTIAAEAARLRP